MARNTGKDSRRGQVNSRTQLLNPLTEHYIKRDSITGRFMDVKSDDNPFKGVAKEKISFKSNPSINKATAQKAENAVRSVKYKM